MEDKAVYSCDVCGEVIENDPYVLDLVTVEYSVLRCNGWNEWSERVEKHVHKGCLARLTDLEA